MKFPWQKSDQKDELLEKCRKALAADAYLKRKIGVMLAAADTLSRGGIGCFNSQAVTLI